MAASSGPCPDGDAISICSDERFSPLKLDMSSSEEEGDVDLHEEQNRFVSMWVLGVPVQLCLLVAALLPLVQAL